VHAAQVRRQVDQPVHRHRLAVGRLDRSHRRGQLSPSFLALGSEPQSVAFGRSTKPGCPAGGPVCPVHEWPCLWGAVAAAEFRHVQSKIVPSFPLRQGQTVLPPALRSCPHAVAARELMYVPRSDGENLTPGPPDQPQGLSATARCRQTPAARQRRGTAEKRLFIE